MVNFLIQINRKKKNFFQIMRHNDQDFLRFDENVQIKVSFIVKEFFVAFSKLYLHQL